MTNIERAKEAAREWWEHTGGGMGGMAVDGNAMADCIDALTEPTLTAAERGCVEYLRVNGPASMYHNTIAEAVAIFDRLVPPPPSHKPCAHCGCKSAFLFSVDFRTGGGRGYAARCLDCEMETRPYRTEAEAWRAWDSRA